MSNPWYVITGGPCAGKTTLIEELSRRGYRTVSEAARLFIERELAKGRTLEDIRKDEVAFQRELILMKVEAERALPKDETIFFDRGMHDSEAYLALCGIEKDTELEEAIQNTSYRKAFLLDLVAYMPDHVRTEDPVLAKRIHDLLGRSYKAHGVEVIPVPIMPVGERADFVLAHL